MGKPFDPAIHEAIMRQPSPEVTEDTVIQEFRKGFRINGKLIRPAMVSVGVPEGEARAIGSLLLLTHALRERARAYCGAASAGMGVSVSKRVRWSDHVFDGNGCVLCALLLPCRALLRVGRPPRPLRVGLRVRGHLLGRRRRPRRARRRSKRAG